MSRYRSLYVRSFVAAGSIVALAQVVAAPHKW